MPPSATVVELMQAREGARAHQGHAAEPDEPDTRVAPIVKSEEWRWRRTLHRTSARRDETTACVRLRVSGVPDTAEKAARLAFAKHLLEVHLQCPIVIGLVDDGALAAASSVEGQTRPAVARLVRRR